MRSQVLTFSRWALAGVGLCLAAIALATATTPAAERTSAATSPRISTPNPAGSHINLTFDPDESLRTASLVVISTPPATLKGYVVGDLVRQDGGSQLPASSVTVLVAPTAGAGTDADEAAMTVSVT